MLLKEYEKNIKVLTSMHLSASKNYPRKWCYFDHTKEGKKMLRQQKKARKLIATWFWFIRNDPEHGPAAARRAHRYNMVNTLSEAKQRLANLQ